MSNKNLYPDPHQGHKSNHTEILPAKVLNTLETSMELPDFKKSLQHYKSEYSALQHIKSLLFLSVGNFWFPGS